MQVVGDGEDTPGGLAHFDSLMDCRAIDAVHIAARNLRAHRAMHVSDRGKASVDRAVREVVVAMTGGDLDDRAQPRLGTTHHVPLPRSKASSARMRRTPSVTCRDDSVAPLMFAMSSPGTTGDDARLSMNCARQRGSRTS